MGWHARLVHLADLNGILALENAAFAADERFNRRQVRRLIGNVNADVFVIAEGSTAQNETSPIIGWGAALTRRRRHAAIGRIYAVAVLPEKRGAHLGRQLTMLLLKALTRRGCQRIYLEVRVDNLPALRLYYSFGFVRHQSLIDYYGQGRHGLRLRFDVPAITEPAQDSAVAAPFLAGQAP